MDLNNYIPIGQITFAGYLIINIKY